MSSKHLQCLKYIWNESLFVTSFSIIHRSPTHALYCSGNIFACYLKDKVHFKQPMTSCSSVLISFCKLLSLTEKTGTMLIVLNEIETSSLAEVLRIIKLFRTGLNGLKDQVFPLEIKKTSFHMYFKSMCYVGLGLRISLPFCK